MGEVVWLSSKKRVWIKLRLHFAFRCSPQFAVWSELLLIEQKQTAQSLHSYDLNPETYVCVKKKKTLTQVFHANLNPWRISILAATED